MAENKTHDNRNSLVQAGQDAARQGASSIQQSAGNVSDALQRSGEVGADAVQRAGQTTRETMRRSTQAVADSQRQIVQDAAERFEDVSRKMTQAFQGAAEDMRTLMMLPIASDGGLQDLQQNLAGLVEGVVQTNLRATQELFRLANPGAFVELQQRFIREYMNVLVQGSTTLVRSIRKTTDQTLPRLEQHLEQRREGQRLAAE